MAKEKKGTALSRWQKKSVEDVEKICGMCGRVSDWMSVDHIIPMSMIDAFGMKIEWGYEDEDNFQLLCRRCNSLKAAKVDFHNPKTLPLLKKYLNHLEKMYGGI